VKNVATLVHDLDNSIASRELVSRFVKSGYFNVVEYTDSEDRVPGRTRAAHSSRCLQPFRREAVHRCRVPAR
jgi:hypothetical protein